MEHNNYIYDERTKREMKSIINFASNLIIKDEDKASKTETFQSNARAYRLISAMLKSDTLDDYEVTKEDLEELDTKNEKYSHLNPKNIPEDKQEIILDFKRFQVYKKYMEEGDSNPYYEDIYVNHIQEYEYEYKTFEDFRRNNNLCFYARARLAQQFSLLYYPAGLLNDEEMKTFQRSYNDVRHYFMNSLYNEAYKIGNDKYNNFCKLMIVFMTIKKYIAARLIDVDNIDLFDEYSIRNMFLSYGLDYFFDMPLKYQKRLLKNINDLIKNKGTDKAIISILQLFGFQNIKIFRYILTKKYKTDENGIIDFENDPMFEFYAIPNEYSNIEEGLMYGYKYSYDEVANTDAYWQLTENDKKRLFEEHFNYLNTKYIDIKSVMNIMENSMDFSYFINLLYRIDKEYKESDNPEGNNLYMYNLILSNKKINLLDAIILLQILIVNKFGYVDNIVKTFEGIRSVYDYNFDDMYDDIYYYLQKMEGPQRFLHADTINDFKKENMDILDVNTNMEVERLVRMFLDNKNFKKELEKEMLKTDDYRYFRELKTYYETSLKSELQFDMFGDHKTYSSFLKSRDPELYNFLENIRKKAEDNPTDKFLIYDQAILEICNTIDIYLDSDDMNFFTQGNTQITDYILDFVYELVDFIKSYTIHVRDITTIYTFDDRFLNRVHYFDELQFQLKMGQADLIDVQDRFAKWHSDMYIGHEQLQVKESEIIFDILIDRFEDILNLKDREELDITVHTKVMDILNITKEHIDYHNYMAFYESTIGELFKDIAKFSIGLDQNDELNIYDDNKFDAFLHIVISKLLYIRDIVFTESQLRIIEHVLTKDGYKYNLNSTIDILGKLKNLDDIKRLNVKIQESDLLDNKDKGEILSVIEKYERIYFDENEIFNIISGISAKDNIIYEEDTDNVNITSPNGNVIDIRDRWKNFHMNKKISKQFNMKERVSFIMEDEYNKYQIRIITLPFYQVEEDGYYKTYDFNQLLKDFEYEDVDCFLINGKKYPMENGKVTLYRYKHKKENKIYIRLNNVTIKERVEKT